MTQEPQTLADSAAGGEAGCSPQLQALPGSPPSGTRGPARPPQVGERHPRPPTAVGSWVRREPGRGFEDCRGERLGEA